MSKLFMFSALLLLVLALLVTPASLFQAAGPPVHTYSSTQYGYSFQCPASSTQVGAGWVIIQNGTQGYRLRCPATAVVRRYDPEGILHVELPDDAVLTVRVLDNPAGLSAEQWVERWFGGQDPDVVPPVLPVLERRSITVAGRPAETLIALGPGVANRRTVIASNQRVYLVDHPLGDAENEEVFRQVLSSLEVGAFDEDRGFQVVAADPTQTIAGLPVPYYSQRDPQWICDQLGTCNCNFNVCTTQTYTGIGDAGCFITSQAMVFQYYTNGGHMNPQQYDTCLTNNGGYGRWSGCAYGLCGAYYSSIAACRPSSVTYVGYSTNLGLLDSDLNNGYPDIAWVDGGNHYVVVIGKTGGVYDIHDPYYARYQISPGEIIHFVRYSGPLPDSTPPTTSAAFSGTAGQNGWYVSNVQVALNASDNPGGSGLKWLKYWIDGAGYTDNDGSASFTISGDGRHSLEYYAEDNAGNREATHTTSVPIDTTAPSGSIALNGGSPTTYATLVRVDATGSDATSGLWQMRLRDGGGTWSNWQSFRSRLYWLLPAQNRHTHGVEVQFRDYAGNESPFYADTIYLDLYPARPASGNYRITKSTLGMSGASHRCTTNYCLGNTSAQPSGVSEMESPAYHLALGYWRTTGTGGVWRIYLPLAGKGW